MDIIQAIGDAATNTLNTIGAGALFLLTLLGKLALIIIVALASWWYVSACQNRTRLREACRRRAASSASRTLSTCPKCGKIMGTLNDWDPLERCAKCR